MTDHFHTHFSNILGTVFFALAVIHTFLTSRFQKISNRYSYNSILKKIFHLLGEVELVFGFWALMLIIILFFIKGWENTCSFVKNVDFSEAVFVFVIMTVTSARPIITFAQRLISRLSHLWPTHQLAAMYFLCLTLGPVLGSFITEPAAMTVTTLILLNQFYKYDVSDRFKYTTLAVLFVNVSIGGVLTNYAAPPVLMVANTWNWSSGFMFLHFGWKAGLAILINTAGATYLLFKELSSLNTQFSSEYSDSRHGMFKIRESLLVALFLAGLIVLGQFQSWWLAPLLANMKAFSLFVGSTLLTAFIDNAALTYLGSQVMTIPDDFKYALVAGAVAGGGLTIIANAPNPAGYSILQKSFGEEGIQPFKLFVHALMPTLVAMACFWIF